MIIPNQKERGVLIIDDEAAVRRALSENLRLHGFTNVQCAEDGLRALTCLELEGPKIYVVVTDVVMPAMDGVKFAEFLTANYHHPTGIIYMSGFADKSKEFRVGNFNDADILDFDFVSKPFNYEELINRILQCGDLVFNRRISLSRYSIESLSKRIDEVHEALGVIQASIKDVETKILSYRRRRSVLEDLGFEVVKAIVIAVFVLVTIKGLEATKLIDAFK